MYPDQSVTLLRVIKTAQRMGFTLAEVADLLEPADSRTLAFVDIPVGDFTAGGRLALISTQGGPTSYPKAGTKHLDGPEYSADGAWLYFNRGIRKPAWPSPFGSAAQDSSQ